MSKPHIIIDGRTVELSERVCEVLRTYGWTYEKTQMFLDPMWVWR